MILDAELFWLLTITFGKSRPFNSNVLASREEVTLWHNIILLAFLKFEYCPSDLMSLLWATRRFNATDPRDKVFALAHFAVDVSPGFIDYSLDLRQVLIRITRDSLARKSPDVLSFTQSLRHTNRGMPTWALKGFGIDTKFAPLTWTFLPSDDLIKLDQSKQAFEITADMVSLPFPSLYPFLLSKIVQ